MAFPVSSLPPGLGSCDYYRRELEGCLLSPAPSPPLGLLPPSLPPTPPPALSLPGPASSAHSAARQLCSIRNHLQLQTIQKGNFGVKCSPAPALSSSLPPRSPRRGRPSLRRPGFFGSSPKPSGGCRFLLGGAPQPGNGGRRGPVGAARRRRGWQCPGTGRWARAGGSPRRLGRCSSCERATPPSLLRRWLVGETRAGSAPSRRARILPWGFPPLSWVKMAV